jgi:hypothetical protein
MTDFPMTRAATIAALLVAGCATDPGAGPSGGAGGSSGPIGMPTGSPDTGTPDVARECAIHHRMMAGKSRAEQQATLRSQMQAMSGRNVTPEQVSAERDRMDKACGAVPAVR